MLELVQHTIVPVFDARSRVLILGTMPSPKSREQGFYYGHPQNRFWKVLAAILDAPLPVTKEEKRRFVLEHKIALWDVLASCMIDGASDSSIRKPVANDINIILKKANIHAIFCTGKKAYTLYNRFCFPQTGMPAVCLPSTSAANCRNCGLEELIHAYQIILDDLKP